MVWIDGCYAAADATLARKAYELGELASFIVETAGLHDGVDALDL